MGEERKLTDSELESLANKILEHMLEEGNSFNYNDDDLIGLPVAYITEFDTYKNEQSNRIIETQFTNTPTNIKLSALTDANLREYLTNINLYDYLALCELLKEKYNFDITSYTEVHGSIVTVTLLECATYKDILSHTVNVSKLI